MVKKYEVVFNILNSAGVEVGLGFYEEFLGKIKSDLIERPEHFKIRLGSSEGIDYLFDPTSEKWCCSYNLIFTEKGLYFHCEDSKTPTDLGVEFLNRLEKIFYSVKTNYPKYIVKSETVISPEKHFVDMMVI